MIGSIIIALRAAVFISLVFLIFSCAAPFGVYHKVKRGETLYGISKQYGTNVDKLKENNNIGDETQLSVGEYLWIPDVKAPKMQTSNKAAHSNVKKKDRSGKATKSFAPKASPSKFN